MAIYILNLVDITKLPCYPVTPTDSVSLETFTLNSFVNMVYSVFWGHKRRKLQVLLLFEAKTKFSKEARESVVTSSCVHNVWFRHKLVVSVVSSCGSGFQNMTAQLVTSSPHLNATPVSSASQTRSLSNLPWLPLVTSRFASLPDSTQYARPQSNVTSTSLSISPIDSL